MILIDKITIWMAETVLYYAVIPPKIHHALWIYVLQYHTRRVVPLHRKGINVLVFSNNQTKQIIPSHPFQQIHSLVSLESKAPSPLDFQEKNTTNLSCCEPGLLSSCPRPPSMTLRRAKASRSGRSRCCTCASSRKPQGTTYWRWIKTG